MVSKFILIGHCFSAYVVFLPSSKALLCPELLDGVVEGFWDGVDFCLDDNVGVDRARTLLTNVRNHLITLLRAPDLQSIETIR